LIDVVTDVMFLLLMMMTCFPFLVMVFDDYGVCYSIDISITDGWLSGLLLSDVVDY
jgi:hypothetical protein